MPVDERVCEVAKKTQHPTVDLPDDAMLDRVLRLGIEIANEVLSFESHIAILGPLTGPGGKRPRPWHYVTGFDAPSDEPRLSEGWRHDRARLLREHGASVPATTKRMGQRPPGTAWDTRKDGQVPFRSSLIVPLFLKEKLCAYIEFLHPSAKKYSKIDIELGTCLSRRLSAALTDEDELSRLERTRILFLHKRRALLEEASIEEVLAHYVGMAIWVLHGGRDHQHALANGDATRASARLADSETNELYYARTVDSRTGKQWSKRAAATRCPVSSKDPGAIAHRRRRPSLVAACGA